MAILIAALAAEGRSEIGNIVQIDRGYESIDERLRGLGARIERVAADRVPGVASARGASDDTPNSTWEQGHPPRRDARASRAPGAAGRGLRELRIRRGGDAHRRVRRGTRDGRGNRRRRRAPVLRLARARCSPCARTRRCRSLGSSPTATRPPSRRFRFFYNARAYRSVRPQRGQTGEFFQAGVELVGSPAPDGTAEVVEVLSAALDAAGLNRAVIGLGDAALYASSWQSSGVTATSSARILALLASRDLVGLDAELATLDLSDCRAASSCGASRRSAAAPRFSTRPRVSAARRWPRLSSGVMDTYEAIAERGIADRVSARPRPPARPRLLHGRDPRGLRPGARPRPRRRRALRRTDGPLRPPASGRRASPSSSSASTSPRPKRSASPRKRGT